MVAPRYAPSSTPEQLAAAGKLLKRYPEVYFQTHLSEAFSPGFRDFFCFRGSFVFRFRMSTDEAFFDVSTVFFGRGVSTIRLVCCSMRPVVVTFEMCFITMLVQNDELKLRKTMMKLIW